MKAILSDAVYELIYRAAHQQQARPLTWSRSRIINHQLGFCLPSRPRAFSSSRLRFERHFLAIVIQHFLEPTLKLKLLRTVCIALE